MAVQTNITITHGNETIQSIKDRLLKPSTKPREAANRVRNFFDAAAIGNRAMSYTAQVTSGDQVAATGTFTVSSGIATDTAVIAGTTLTCVDHRETTNVTFQADSSGSLNSTFFTFQDQPGTHKYYIWFNINSAGVDPAPAGRTGIQVAGATGATAATLATAAVAAAAAVSGLTVSAGTSGHIIIRNVAPGTATATADGSAATSFTFTRSITGSAVTSSQYQVFATDTLTAADLVRAINANTTTSQYVSAANLAGVVTCTCTVTGVIGNAIATTATGGVSAGQVRLTGGAAPVTVSTTNTYHLAK